MKKIILPAILLSAWMIFFSTDIPVGNNYLPALGRFVNPFTGVARNTTDVHADITLKGMTKGEVKILFDERDVPHIYAQNLEDAIYAQGYLHAANRLFAMDVSTRSAAGRLSELIGSRTIEIDKRQRQRGFEQSAIEKAKNWESYEGNKEIIDAYVNGVNDYIKTLSYAQWPIEYKLMSHGPVVWTATHTALMATNMAIMLCMSESDLKYTHARNILTPGQFEYLYPDHNPLESPIIPAGTPWDFSPIKSTSSNTTTMPVIPSSTEDDRKKDINGSNNWAIAPSKTQNGFALLANDPHLSLTLPNIWYEMEIHTPEMNVHGASIPGLPFIVIGFNDSIAWGTTNSGQDVLDWYEIQWKDSTRQQYMLDGKYVDAELRVEEIMIRGQEPVFDTVRYTHWGPVTSVGDNKDMAMKWIGHQRAKENDIAYLKKINKGRTLADYRSAVEDFQYPAQNKVFASTSGDIAITVAGVMPVRPAGEGTFILDGSKTVNDWQGFIPFAQAPHIINPASGYVSSANQAPAESTYPYPQLGVRTFEDYRGRVINMVLDSAEKLTVKDMMALQENNYNLHAAELLPLFLEHLDSATCVSPDDRRIIAQLQNWNYEYHRDSVSPVLFDIWYEAFDTLVFDELDEKKLMHPEEWRIIELTRDAAHHPYFDIISTTDKIETVDDIICASFKEMINQLGEIDADSKKNWGSYKASAIPHLARLEPFGIKFLSTSGAKHIVNAMGKSHGPSWRMIVELSNPPKAYINYPGGQSGNPASPHFKDFVPSFFEGKYYEVTLKNEPGWKASRSVHITPK